MNNYYQAVISSPIGQLGICTTNTHLTSIHFLITPTSLQTPNTAIALETSKQLQNYFYDPLFVFNLPYLIKVSTFKEEVLRLLRQIPVGETRSYGDIAMQLNTSPRPIGGACRSNPIPIVIPCHRVIAKNHLGGFNGARQGTFLIIKQWLLHHESQLNLL